MRHWFSSNLAMRGTPARAIQVLAGRKDLAMIQRCMHLTAAELDAAIRLLEEPAGRCGPVVACRILEGWGETAPGTKTINESGD
jgi:hypothetical protein